METVLKITGMVIERSNETINKNIPTGEIEVKIKNIDILGETKELPMPVGMFLFIDFNLIFQ